MAHEAVMVRETIEPYVIPSPVVRKDSAASHLVEFQPLFKPGAPRGACQTKWAAPERTERRAADTNIDPLLASCENLFFAFDFPYLIFSSTLAIDQNTTYGDAFAFRCFALLGQLQQGVKPDMDSDLVDLLRDYFRACERPLVTEGGTVCRLFLKLVFGDLVKRIARAQQGAKFALDKNDLLCGGAFAMLEGDFFTARQMFDTAIIDPASHAYAWAGLGLLHVMDSDVPQAVKSFSRAGVGDEDILTMSRFLRH